MSSQPSRVLLHAGPMKTGTTFLQSKLEANRAELAEQGVHFAGPTWRHQDDAVRDLVGLPPFRGVEDRGGSWPAFVDQTREADAPTVLLSMEFLAIADAEIAERAVTELESQTGREVHLILTVRDTARVLPAQWNTAIQSGTVSSWPRFLRYTRASIAGGGRVGRALARTGQSAARGFTDTVDIPRMLKAWSRALPPDRIHVVVVPQPSAPRDLLWELFCGTIGVPADALPGAHQSANESMGYASAEVMRHLNIELLSRDSGYRRDLIKELVALDVLAALRDGEARAELDPATFRASLRWNKVVRNAIASSGVRVYGELADLPTDPAGSDQRVVAHQAPPTEPAMLKAATAVFDHLFELHPRRTRRLRPTDQAEDEIHEIQRQLVKPPNWPTAPDPLAAAVADLATLCLAITRLPTHQD